MEIDSGLSLYDINKQLMAQLNPLDFISFNKETEKMIDDIWKTNKKYWMLLCAERNDYTIFIVLTKEGTLKEIRPTLHNRGEILSIEKQDDGNYEIWIRDNDTKENFAYYLFDYSDGIIQA